MANEIDQYTGVLAHAGCSLHPCRVGVDGQTSNNVLLAVPRSGHHLPPFMSNVGSGEDYHQPVWSSHSCKVVEVAHCATSHLRLQLHMQRKAL